MADWIWRRRLGKAPAAALAELQHAPSLLQFVFVIVVVVVSEIAIVTAIRSLKMAMQLVP